MFPSKIPIFTSKVINDANGIHKTKSKTSEGGHRVYTPRNEKEDGGIDLTTTSEPMRLHTSPPDSSLLCLKLTATTTIMEELTMAMEPEQLGASLLNSTLSTDTEPMESQVNLLNLGPGLFTARLMNLGQLQASILSTAKYQDHQHCE